MKKLIALTMTLICLITIFSSCGSDKTDVPSSTLSFSQANSVEEMKALNGEQVSIIGYMSTLSPITGSFMYLMNLPYQSCPFCVPNTSQLSNTIAVYAKNGDSFEFTDRAIKVTGTLEFGDYTDEYGYEYAYRICDAIYSEIDTSEMGEKIMLWQQLASTDVVSEIYTMYEYVNFLCLWSTYTAEFESGKDYLYPSDALLFVEQDGAQFNYGYKDNYFSDIIKTVEEVNKSEFKDLIKNIKKAEELADKALTALKNDEYSVISEYSGIFNDGRKQYRMNDSSLFETEMETLYKEFSTWLTQWEV